MLTNIYGKPVKDNTQVVIVSPKEAARLVARAEALKLKCTCPSCNPPEASTHGH